MIVGVTVRVLTRWQTSRVGGVKVMVSCIIFSVRQLVTSGKLLCVLKRTHVCNVVLVNLQSGSRCHGFL